MPDTVNSPLSSRAYSISSVYVNGGFLGLYYPHIDVVDENSDVVVVVLWFVVSIEHPPKIHEM